MTIAELLTKAGTHARRVSPSVLEVHQYAGTARIIDVREPEELAEQGYIAGAVHVPRGLLEFWADPTSPSHHPELDPGYPTVVYCGAGQRSALAAQTLSDLGYDDVALLDGGLEAWKRAGHPVAGLKPWHTDRKPPHTNHLHTTNERSTP